MNLLLVHGAAHTEQCWERLGPLLVGQGHTVKSITLSGHGEELASYYGTSLRKHATEICNSASKFGDQCVLLGHSMGGMTVSAAAELQPELFSKLVYLAAWVPSLEFPSMLALARKFPNKNVGTTARISIIKGCAIPKLAEATEFFYSDCDPEASADIYRYLCSQPLRPVFAKVRPSQRGCRSIPKSYIECTRDRAILIEHQRAMQAHMDFQEVLTLDSDHSPFYGMPEALAEAIQSIVHQNPQVKFT